MNEAPSTDPGEAAEALRAFAAAGDAAMRRGEYSRTRAVLVAGWAGGLAVAVGFETGWMLEWLFAGIFGLILTRRRAGAWVQEVPSPAAGRLVIALGLLFGVLFLAGNVARQDFGFGAAPFLAGGVIAGGLFALMEWGRRGRLRADGHGPG